MEDFVSLELAELSSGSGVVDNYTLTNSCAASSLQSSANVSQIIPTPIAISARVFQVLYGSLQVIFGILLNVLILILVFRFKKLRTISFAIAVQIAIANLALTVNNGIPTIVNHIAGRFILGLEFCITSGLVAYMLTDLRTLLIFVFSFDRFASVFAPFFYPKHSRRIIILMCVLAWCISTATNLMSIPQILDCCIFVEPTLTCEISSRCSKICKIFLYTIRATSIFPAVIATVAFFLALYIKGRKIRRKESKMLGLVNKSITDQEWRALKTFSLLFLAVFLVIIIPILLFNMAALFGTVVHFLVVKLAFNIITLLVITDPIILLRNADVKEAFHKLTKPLVDFCHKNLQRKEQDI